MTGLVVQPHVLARIKNRAKTRLTLPAENRCPFTPGRVYLARSPNAGWTAADLKDHRDWASEEHPTRARAVLAYLDSPVDDAVIAPNPVEVTVLEVHLATLGQVDQHAAQREGFRFLAQFQTWWRAEHGFWEPDASIWVVNFTVGDLRDLFDRPRLLKATPGTISGNPDTTPEHQDYTDRPHLAMSDEPEGVDARTAERFAAEGFGDHARRKSTELRWQQVRSLRIRLHEAERAKDWVAVDAALRELGRLAA